LLSKTGVQFEIRKLLTLFIAVNRVETFQHFNRNRLTVQVAFSYFYYWFLFWTRV